MEGVIVVGMIPSPCDFFFGMQYYPEMHRHFVEGNITGEEYCGFLHDQCVQRMKDEGIPQEGCMYIYPENQDPFSDN